VSEATTREDSFLVCDDDAPFRKRLARALRDRGFVVYEAENAESGLEFFGEYSPKRVLVDLRMPGAGGLWLVGEISARDPGCSIVVLTGFGSIATALEAVRKGALNYLTKPASVEQILAAFNSEGERADITQEMPSLAQVEAEYVQRVLDQCGGNVSRSAKVLGVNRRSLQRRMKKS
jgi:two-component system response regulator RegA